jgi:hypothetical protein
MEVILSAKTAVTVTAKISQFKTETKQGQDIMYVRNDKIYGAQITTAPTFTWTLFFIFLAVGVFGGLGHYLYDTQFLGYNPNPPIIAGIFALFTIIGVVVSIRKKRILELVLDSNQSKDLVTFTLDKEANQAHVEDLIDILVN